MGFAKTLNASLEGRMYHRTRRMLLIVPCIALFPAAVMAQQSPDWQACNIADTSGAAAKIAGCTRVLERGGQSPRQTAIALANRGMAYTWKNDIDLALADFSEAIRVDPDFPNWRYARAMQYEKKGQYQLALADLNEAVRLRPDSAEYIEAVRRVQGNGSIKAVFEKYSLLGIFAWDCSKPASKSNLYYVHRLLDADRVQRDQMSGPADHDWVTVIDKAQPLSPNELALSGTLTGRVGGRDLDNVPTSGTWRIEPNRFVQRDATVDGVKVIGGGTNLSAGVQLPWINRCGG
jgi:tetratricopeptide (TPR) repeat protein